MRRRWLAPEVVQTSALDCGPAALKSLLQGFGVRVSYERLREACQTDLDGTSIDTIEDVARDLGLPAEQVMVPPDHLLLDPAILPAIVVVRLPQDLTHFVLVWRRAGPLLQVMDPAVGRHWVRARDFLSDVYVHPVAVPGQQWKEWAAAEPVQSILAKRMAAVGHRSSARAVDEAARSPDWRRLASLDAASRFVESLAARGVVRRGAQAQRLIDAMPAELIPQQFWNAQPRNGEGAEAARVSGAILVRAAGPPQHAARTRYSGDSAEIAAAVREPRTRPFRELWQQLRGEPASTFAWTAAALGLAGLCLIAETLLLRAGLDARTLLFTTEQRVHGLVLLALFGITLLLLEHRIAATLLRLGRRLETRFRVAFLTRLAGLNDRYFRSRLIADMAERIHAAHHLHELPRLLGRLAQVVIALLLTTAAIVFVEPRSAAAAPLAAAVTLGLGLACAPAVQRHDLKVRTLTGALARFYFDALRGLTALRAHSAEAVVRREQESLLLEWHRASRVLARSLLVCETLLSLVGTAFAFWLVKLRPADGGEPGATLLLAYWALSFPRLGVELAGLAKQHAEQRSVALRLLEPLGLAEGGPAAPDLGARPPGRGPAAAVSMRGVTVRAGGHTILSEVDIDIPAGAHVGIVGPSGSGKSTLVGLLLGWHRPAAGEVLVDGQPLREDAWPAARREIAWVDPIVHLWNDSLERNVAYGAASAEASALARALARAELHEVIERLGGLQARIGEAGGRLSGGEGQRTRLARAMLKSDARAVILDEAFRGLDRATRQRLLDQSRALWRKATLLCVTHDVQDTLALDRVLVLADGRVREDGNPGALAKRPDSLYAQLLARERDARRLWSRADIWRKLELHDGQLVQQDLDPDRDSTHDARLATRPAC